MPPEKLETLFSEWDEDHDGIISKREFRNGIAKLGLRAPPEEVNMAFDSIDANGDGKLSLEELLAHLTTFVDDSSFRHPGHGALPEGRRSVKPGRRLSGSVSMIPINRVRRASKLSDNMVVPSEERPHEGTAGRRAGKGDAWGDANSVEAPPSMAAAAATATAAAVPEPANDPGSAHSAVGPRADAATKVQTASASPPPSPPAAASSPTAPSGPARGLRRRSLAALAGSMDMEELKETREAKLRIQEDVRADLDRGGIWSIKFNVLFPMLSKLQAVDHLARVIFPLAYAITTIAYFARVRFGLTAAGDTVALESCM